MLIEGLRWLEYWGYDSAGIATLVNGRIDRRRAEGKLDKRVQELPIAGTIGIGHTRWATHGGPTENNAHPHATRKVAVVHNGIIENYQELKAQLEIGDHVFDTDTDTEVIIHLVTHYLETGTASGRGHLRSAENAGGSLQPGTDLRRRARSDDRHAPRNAAGRRLW